MPIKLLLLGGGWGFLERGVGSANFIFMGVGIFPSSTARSATRRSLNLAGGLDVCLRPLLRLAKSPIANR